MKARKTVLLLVGVLSICVLASPAFAADDHHALPVGNFLLRILNAAIFLWIIYHFVGKKIKAVLTSRGEHIVHDLDDFDKKKKKALENLADVEKRIANVEEECAKLLSEGKAQAEKLAASIISDAEKQAQSILDQAHKSTEQAVKSEVDAIRAKLADEIVAEVRKNLEKSLDESKHQDLINNSLKKVSSF